MTLSESTLAVPEGGSATYTVRLDTRPAGGTVTVGGACSGISASPMALTFTGTNWNAARTLRVSAAEDDNPTHESVDMTLSVAGADYGRRDGWRRVGYGDGHEPARGADCAGAGRGGRVGRKADWRGPQPANWRNGLHPRLAGLPSPSPPIMAHHATS